jgi:hypothetical protein
MIHIPGVTLIVQAPTEPPNLGAMVVNRITEHLEFDDVKLLTTSPPSIDCPGSFVEVPLTPWAEWQKVQAYGLHEYFDTPHALVCECDGFPINPHLWDPAWLKYDYIGAPWAPLSNPRQANAPDQFRVGNGGCSLQSKEFRELLFAHRRFYIEGMPSDIWFAQREDIRRKAAMAQMTFAPLAEAIRFSFESDVPEYPGWNTSKSFAFHGRNLHPQHMII